MRPRLGGRIGILSRPRLSQRAGAGGQGEAGAGAGDGACSGAMAVGAVRGAGLGFFFAGAGLRAATGGDPGCNSTKTGFGTRRGAVTSASLLGSRGSVEATTRTGTVCG